MRKSEYPLLAAHIKDAKELAQKTADVSDDGGPCNLDTLTLWIPRLRTDWLEALGIRCYRLGSAVAISATFGMGNKQTRGVEAMADHLGKCGYNASIWYQLD